MSMCDRLPERKDGTLGYRQIGYRQITPWDAEWTNEVSRGIYEPRWCREEEKVKKVKIAVPEPIKTGENVDPGMVLMFIKGSLTGPHGVGDDGRLGQRPLHRN